MFGIGFPAGRRGPRPGPMGPCHCPPAHGNVTMHKLEAFLAPYAPYNTENIGIFGNCAIIRKKKEELLDLTENLWSLIGNIKITNKVKSDKSDKSDDSEEDDESNETMESTDNDSELKEEDYIYSSEEENLNK